METNDQPVYNYQPPTVANTNQNVPDQAALAALVERMVSERLAQQGMAPPAKVPTPEEEARAALDNQGAGLGIEERLRELYRHVDLIAKKVGI